MKKDNPTAIELAEGRLRHEQKTYLTQRGNAALAGIVVDAFIAIENIIATTSTEDQTLILNRHQINMATGSTSVYSPWIAAIFGEPDHDKPKVKDLDGVERPTWVPNASFAVYFHTMETFHERGFSAATHRQEMIDYIKSTGGTQKVANLRKARLAKEGKPAQEASEQAQRELYLTYGPRLLIDLPPAALELGSKAGRFVTILVERDESGLIFRGVAEMNASDRLNKLAADAHKSLLDRREQVKVISIEVEKARREERERVLAEVNAAKA